MDVVGAGEVHADDRRVPAVRVRRRRRLGHDDRRQLAVLHGDRLGRAGVVAGGIGRRVGDRRRPQKEHVPSRHARSRDRHVAGVVVRDHRSEGRVGDDSRRATGVGRDGDRRGRSHERRGVVDDGHDLPGRRRVTRRVGRGVRKRCISEREPVATRHSGPRRRDPGTVVGCGREAEPVVGDDRVRRRRARPGADLQIRGRAHLGRRGIRHRHALRGGRGVAGGVRRGVDDRRGADREEIPDRDAGPRDRHSGRVVIRGREAEHRIGDEDPAGDRSRAGPRGHIGGRGDGRRRDIECDASDLRLVVARLVREFGVHMDDVEHGPCEERVTDQNVVERL